MKSSVYKFNDFFEHSYWQIVLFTAKLCLTTMNLNFWQTEIFNNKIGNFVLELNTDDWKLRAVIVCLDISFAQVSNRYKNN